MKLLLIISLAQVIHGQVSVIGNCPDVPMAENYQLDKNLGNWYILARYRSMFDDSIGCFEANFTLIKDGYIEGDLTGIKKADNSVVNVLTECTYTSDKLYIVIRKKAGVLKLAMKPIATNNADYTAYWGCVQFDTYSQYYTWIFTKERTLSPDLYNKVLDVYKQYNLHDQLLRNVDQTNCPDL